MEPTAGQVGGVRRTVRVLAASEHGSSTEGTRASQLGTYVSIMFS